MGKLKNADSLKYATQHKKNSQPFYFIFIYFLSLFLSLLQWYNSLELKLGRNVALKSSQDVLNRSKCYIYRRSSHMLRWKKRNWTNFASMYHFLFSLFLEISIAVEFYVVFIHCHSLLANRTFRILISQNRTERRL